MKLENDLGDFHPSPPRKSYNPFDSDDDTLDFPGLKSENMYVKENNNGFNLKAFEKSSDNLIFHMDNGEFLWKEDVLGQPATGDHAVNPNSNGNAGFFQKERQPYTDKNVTECELPEFVICYKEGKIKDIGIDEGVSSHNKLWLHSGKKKLVDMKAEESSNQLGVAEARKSTLDSELQKDPVNLDGLNEEALTGNFLVHEFGDSDLLKITELNLDIEDRALMKDGLVSDVEDHLLVYEKEPETNPRKHDEPNHDETSQGEQTQSTSTENATEALPKESSMKEESLILDDTHDSNKMAYNSKLESRSITFDFGASTNSKPEKVAVDDDPENAHVVKPPPAQTMTRQQQQQEKDGIASNSILLAELEDRDHGETSFSAGMPIPLPSFITFSEPLTYSGSVSLRSDSSAGTTSTRSFAFPVLQTEWDSSPARMGKAGQRHMKKHKGWVHAFSCCKF